MIDPISALGADEDGVRSAVAGRWKLSFTVKEGSEEAGNCVSTGSSPQIFAELGGRPLAEGSRVTVYMRCDDPPPPVGQPGSGTNGIQTDGNPTDDTSTDDTGDTPSAPNGPNR
ncbi:hypothetical protein [Pseudonocardia yuanmonensis]